MLIYTSKTYNTQLGKLKPGHTGEHEGVSLLHGESKDPSACYVTNNTTRFDKQQANMIEHTKIS